MIEELKVPVPWGDVAVKAWGDPTFEAVIVLHGLLDNAGSFDTLIPLLPQHYYYICVDLPGHGLSSYFPPSLPIFYENFVFAVHSVVEHFKREKYMFIAHSLGGRVTLLFTQMYPDYVSKLILLDTGYTFPLEPKDFLESRVHGYDLLKKTLRFKPENNPTYTYEEIVHRIIYSRFLGTLTYEAAEQLAGRMTKKVGDDRYEFTFDRRLREILYPSFSEEYIKRIFKVSPVTCPALVIYASDTRKLVTSKRSARKYFNLPNFKLAQVKGHHHSHHTNPELFAPIITKFLFSKHKSKL